MSVCCECCVLSGRGLCDGLITRSEESYRLWHVFVWSRNLVNEEVLACGRLLRQKQTNKLTYPVHFPYSDWFISNNSPNLSLTLRHILATDSINGKHMYVYVYVSKCLVVVDISCSGRAEIQGVDLRIVLICEWSCNTTIEAEKESVNMIGNFCALSVTFLIRFLLHGKMPYKIRCMQIVVYSWRAI